MEKAVPHLSPITHHPTQRRLTSERPKRYSVAMSQKKGNTDPGWFFPLAVRKEREKPRKSYQGTGPTQDLNSEAPKCCLAQTQSQAVLPSRETIPVSDTYVLIRWTLA